MFPVVTATGFGVGQFGANTQMCHWALVQASVSLSEEAGKSLLLLTGGWNTELKGGVCGEHRP